MISFCGARRMAYWGAVEMEHCSRYVVPVDAFSGHLCAVSESACVLVDRIAHLYHASGLFPGEKADSSALLDVAVDWFTSCNHCYVSIRDGRQSCCYRSFPCELGPRIQKVSNQTTVPLW